MKNNLREAIEKGRIVSFSDGPRLVAKELETAREDLADAQHSFDEERYKWATVQAYYAMFHAARALLYAKKFREKSHIYLGRAILALYGESKELTGEYYDNFMQGMNLRELADYKRKFSKDGAQRLIQAAKNNIMATERITGKNR